MNITRYFSSFLCLSCNPSKCFPNSHFFFFFFFLGREGGEATLNGNSWNRFLKYEMGLGIQPKNLSIWKCFCEIDFWYGVLKNRVMNHNDSGIVFISECLCEQNLPLHLWDLYIYFYIFGINFLHQLLYKEEW